MSISKKLKLCLYFKQQHHNQNEKKKEHSQKKADRDRTFYIKLSSNFLAQHFYFYSSFLHQRSSAIIIH